MAWGQTCNACDRQNHFTKVCQSKGENKWSIIQCINDKEATMDDLIAHVIFDPEINTNISSNDNGHEEVETTFIPFFPHLNIRQVQNIPTTYATRLRIYPDGRAIICLGDPKHLWYMRLSERNLIPSKKGFMQWEVLVCVNVGYLFTIKGRTRK